MDVLNMIKKNNKELTRESIIEELYWSSLSTMTKDEMTNIVKPFLMNSERIAEYAAVQKLYSNPEGAYINFFEDVIIDLYKKDPYTFIRAIGQNPDEGMNVLYIFRNKAIFLDPESKKQALLNAIDDIETKDMIESFFKYYDSICST